MAVMVRVLMVVRIVLLVRFVVVFCLVVMACIRAQVPPTGETHLPLCNSIGLA